MHSNGMKGNDEHRGCYVELNMQYGNMKIFSCQEQFPNSFN